MGVCTATTIPDEEAPEGSQDNPWVIKQGITFKLRITVNKAIEDGGGPFDLIGPPNYTGRSELRRLAEDTGAPVATWTVTNDPAVTGRAEQTLFPANTVSIPPGNYVFDTEFKNDTDPTDVVPGTPDTQHARVVAGVTKS